MNPTQEIGPRIVLGTAQWRGGYGLFPRDEEWVSNHVNEVVPVARESEIHCIDTAPSYGAAEVLVAELPQEFLVQTKVEGRSGDIHGQVRRSLQRLKRESLWSVLVHDWRQLEVTQRRECAAELEILRSEGVIQRVGVSTYHPEEIRAARESFHQLDVVQAPVSVLDQRLDTSGIGLDLASTGCTVQARSVFLQGLLVNVTSESKFQNHPDIQRLAHHGFAKREDALRTSLEYVQTRDWISEIVVGANSAIELLEILSARNGEPSNRDWSSLASSDTHLIDPTTWS